MCVNDIAVAGAEPLFFLDYFASGKLDVKVGEAIVRGIADGCMQAGCALIGGETAELPGFYAAGEYDLAGFAVGVVERKKILDGARIQIGDQVIGLSSSGLHSNGYSLARKALLEKMNKSIAEVGDALLTPTRIYVRALKAAIKSGDVRGAAHITGGGLVENPPRILRPGIHMRLREGSWPEPEIFRMIAEGANVSRHEMRRTFNVGLGMLIVVPPSDVKAMMTACDQAGEKSHLVGEIFAGDASEEPRVEFT